MAGLVGPIVEGIATGVAAAGTEHVLSHLHDHSGNDHVNPNLVPGPSYIPPIPDFGGSHTTPGGYCPIPGGSLGGGFGGGW